MTARPKVSILTIGNEILDGRILDSNSQYLCDRLSAEGFQVPHTLSANDRIEEICASLTFLSENSDAAILSGGLGPTSDDLTREAVAKFANVTLFQDDSVLTALKGRYEKRGRSFDPSNAKQAMFPETAFVIPNQHGTAAGFEICVQEKSNIRIFSVPGIPSELKQMFEDSILPDLISSFPNRKKMHYRTLRLFGLPESTAGRLVSEVLSDTSIEVSYRASFPVITVRLGTDDQSKDLDSVAHEIQNALGSDYIFNNDPSRNLPEEVFELLRAKELTLSLAESCTGGMLGSLLTAFAGSSEVLLGGCVSYSNAAKVSELGVSEDTLTRFGAVSFETAKEMARGAKDHFHSDLALSITGIAGPGGGSTEKPVGTFYVGLARDKELHAFKFYFPGKRQQIRRFACFCALDQIRRMLLGLRFLGEQG